MDDLAGVVDRGGLERAVDRAEALRLLDSRALEDTLERSAGRHGSATLRALLGDFAGRPPTRSELEQRFLAICTRARLPSPLVNARLPLPDGGVEVDFLWPKEHLVVETDGYRFHGTRSGFERDRARDRRLLLAGYRVVRFTWRQLSDDRDEVVATLRALLHPAQPLLER